MTRKCCVNQCNNSEWQRNMNKAQNITFHMFPKDHVLNTIWCDQIKAANNDELIPGNTAVVCSAHFRESDFKLRKNGQRVSLVSSAVPSIFEQSEIGHSTTCSSPSPDEFIVSFVDGNVSVVKSNSNESSIASDVGSVNESTIASDVGSVNESTIASDVGSVNESTIASDVGSVNESKSAYNVDLANESTSPSSNINTNAERTIWIRDLNSMTATYPGISDGIIISPSDEPALETNSCSNFSNVASVNAMDSLADYLTPSPRKRVIRYPGDIVDTMEMSPDTLCKNLELCKTKIKKQAKEIYHLRQKTNRQSKQIKQLKEQVKVLKES